MNFVCKNSFTISFFLDDFKRLKDKRYEYGKKALSDKSFDVAEAFINRAVYIEKLGLNDDAGKYYFDAVLRISKLLTH